MEQFTKNSGHLQVAFAGQFPAHPVIKEDLIRSKNFRQSNGLAFARSGPFQVCRKVQ